MKQTYDEEIRLLKVHVREKEETNASLVTELEVTRRTSEAQRKQQENHHELELEALKGKVKASEDRYAQLNFDSNRALEEKKAELHEVYKDIRESKSSLESEVGRLHLEIRLKQEMLWQLAEKHHQEEVKLLNRQKMEAKEYQLHDKEEIQNAVSGLGVNDETAPRSMDVDTTEASKRIEELEAEIAEMKEELECQNFAFNALLGKERKANDELDEARVIGIVTLRYLEEKKNIIDDIFKKSQPDKFKTRQQIGVKMVGSIDETPWTKAFRERNVDDETGAKKLSSWRDRIRNSNYQPYKRKKYGPGDDEWKQVVDGEEQHLSTLRKELGEAVYQTVVVALQELEEHNPSGRYPISRAWNFDKTKPGPANMKDVLNYISRVTEALVLRINPTNKRSRA